MNASEPGVSVDLQNVVGAWWRIGVAVVIAAQSMAYSVAVSMAPPDGNAYWVVHTVLIFAAGIVCWLLLPPLVSEAMVGIRQRRIGVEPLFLVTLLGALVASLIGSATHGPVFYEVISILLAVYSVGKTLSARSRAQALRVVEETREAFDTVTLKNGERVSVRELSMGSCVVVGPGEAIAVDGIVRSGRSFVRETAMTGEWQPVVRGPGDSVQAGTFTIDGRLEIENTALAGKRRMDAVLESVAAAGLAESRLQSESEKIAARFLPLVLAVSVGAFAFWAWRDGWVAGIFPAMSVLLVACPCALGLATPLAIWHGLAQLSRLGLLARSGDALDALGRADVVCFDKTGTLSENEVSVVEWQFEPEWRNESTWLRGAVIGAERDFAHPIARAFLAEKDFPAIEPIAVRVEPGCGIEAEVARANGDRVCLRVGEGAWAVKNFRSDETRSAPTRVVFVSVDGVLAARVILAERWREGATEEFAQLEKLGVRMEVLTGDRECRALVWAPQVAVRGGLFPEEKLEHVRALKADGATVCFVGDGLNDAAAMAAADVAVAMRSGAALAKASASVVFLGSDLRTFAEALRLARSVRRGIASNLRFALLYNTAGMAIAAAGWLHPVIAAVLMAVSSAVVSARAIRSGKLMA